MVPSKKDLRSQVKTLINQLSTVEHSEKSDMASVELLDFLRSKSLKKIAIFYSLSDEINTSRFIEKYAGEFSFFLPKINLGADFMLFYPLLNFESNLQKGSYSILEPIETLSEVSCEDLDCVIIPARGVDFEGNRLGRGKGYYDKFLSGCRNSIIKVGFIFQLQMFKEITAEDHDIPLDFCVTEKGSFQFRRK